MYCTHLYIASRWTSEPYKLEVDRAMRRDGKVVSFLIAILVLLRKKAEGRREG